MITICNLAFAPSYDRGPAEALLFARSSRKYWRRPSFLMSDQQKIPAGMHVDMCSKRRKAVFDPHYEHMCDSPGCMLFIVAVPSEGGPCDDLVCFVIVGC